MAFTNTGTILADEGAATITGQTSFASSGTLDLQDGAVSDVLTINSAFVGSGGSNLLVNVNGAQTAIRTSAKNRNRIAIVNASMALASSLVALRASGGISTDGSAKSAASALHRQP